MRLALSSALALLSFAAAAPAGPPGDAARGAMLYERCQACHALTYNRTGPRHCGLLGRRAGTQPGFDYSAALAGSGIVWDRPSLDRFLEDPTAVVPGTLMTYDGIKEPAERADLIAYLAEAGAGPSCR